MPIFSKSPKLTFKVFVLAVSSVIITAAALVILAFMQSNKFHKLAQREVDGLITADLDNITRGVYNLVTAENEAVQEQVSSNLNVARRVIERAGGVRLSDEEVNWECRNQLTGESIRLKLPKMLAGSVWLGNNADPETATIIVDDTTKLVGETTTIFQRMNKKGDMLRVATTVKDNSNKRAIGTYIAAHDPDGTPNPVISAIMRNSTYHGRAFVVDKWYLTAYEPIKDDTGAIIGMLYVGVEQKSVEKRIVQAILNTSVGKTGYVYVLSGKGADRGRYIVSQRGERDGENIWNSQDSDGNYIIQEIIAKAMALKPGELGTIRYRWQNVGENKPRWKVARIQYYEPWDWVIGASVYEDELQEYRSILRDGQRRMATVMVLAGLLITILVGLIGISISWLIVRPVIKMTKAVQNVLRGDLKQVVSVETQDEIGELAAAFNKMAEDLNKTMVSRDELQKEMEERKRVDEELRRTYENLKSTQNQLIQSEKMATVGQLAAGVAHEINNPTGFIMCNATTLKEYITVLANVIKKYEGLEKAVFKKLYDDGKETVKELKKYKEAARLDYILSDMPKLIDESLEGLHRITKIVSDLKTFSHAESQDRKLADINESIEMALNICGNELKFKAEIIKQFSQLPKIVCHPHQLSQVFLNLLINAMQAIDKNGTITVRTYGDDNYLYVDVTDTGSGMPPEVIKHLFEPFFTTKPVGQGTGLGLSLAYNIIKNHEGDIIIKSDVGHGSTITVKLPIGGTIK